MCVAVDCVDFDIARNRAERIEVAVERALYFKGVFAELRRYVAELCLLVAEVYKPLNILYNDAFGRIYHVGSKLALECKLFFGIINVDIHAVSAACWRTVVNARNCRFGLNRTGTNSGIVGSDIDFCVFGIGIAENIGIQPSAFEFADCGILNLSDFDVAYNLVDIYTADGVGVDCRCVSVVNVDCLRADFLGGNRFDFFARNCGCVLVAFSRNRRACGVDFTLYAVFKLYGRNVFGLSADKALTSVGIENSPLFHRKSARLGFAAVENDAVSDHSGRTRNLDVRYRTDFGTVLKLVALLNRAGERRFAVVFDCCRFGVITPSVRSVGGINARGGTEQRNQRHSPRTLLHGNFLLFFSHMTLHYWFRKITRITNSNSHYEGVSIVLGILLIFCFLQ